MKTGYHAVYEKEYIEAIDNAASNGFDFVQFDLNIPHFYLDGKSDTELRTIREYARGRNIEITLHAPGDNVSLFSDFPLIRRGILGQFRLILEKANVLGARHVTVHAGVRPGFRKSGMKTDEYGQTYRDYYGGVLYENLKELIGCRGKTLICLENHKFDELVMHVAGRLISEDMALYLTLDTAKMYTKALELDERIFGFMMEHISSIREMHLHDMNREFGSHQMLGTGIVDFSLFRKLIVRDDIYLNFEVRPLEAARLSRERFLDFLKPAVWRGE